MNLITTAPQTELAANDGFMACDGCGIPLSTIALPLCEKCSAWQRAAEAISLARRSMPDTE